MLLIENKKDLKTYTIKNKYLYECGVLNEKNVCNACMEYMGLRVIIYTVIVSHGIHQKNIIKSKLIIIIMVMII